VRLAPELGPSQRALLCDPQTSGGLLAACAQSAVAEVMSTFVRHGFPQAALIGEMGGDAPIVQVGT
jgi:selenide,water dikinase